MSEVRGEDVHPRVKQGAVQGGQGTNSASLGRALREGQGWVELESWTGIEEVALAVVAHRGESKRFYYDTHLCRRVVDTDLTQDAESEWLVHNEPLSEAAVQIDRWQLQGVGSVHDWIELGVPDTF